MYFEKYTKYREYWSAGPHLSKKTKGLLKKDVYNFKYSNQIYVLL